MKTTQSTLTTATVFSDDGTKRYLLQKCWDPALPKICVIMLCAGTAAEHTLDSTNLLVLNNSVTLGYGTVDVLNLFSTVGDYALKEAEDEDPENMDAILSSAKQADTIVYCPGVGKAKNKDFMLRSKQVLESLRPYESKLYCLTDAHGHARLQHPLSPAVRTWHLSPFKVAELLPPDKEIQSVPQKETKGKTPKASKSK